MRLSIKSRNYLKKCLGFLLILGFISLGAIGGCNNNGGGSDNVGRGPGFVTPFGISVEANGNLVVIDSGLLAVVRVNQLTGDRTILSGTSIGNGPGFVAPRGIVVEADGNLVVTDFGLVAVVRVDQVSGDRTIISDVNTGSGPGFITPLTIVVEADGSLVVTDRGLGGGTGGPGQWRSHDHIRCQYG